MSHTFNCGIGFVLISSRDSASTIIDQLHRAGEPHAAVVGSVVRLNAGMHPAVMYHCAVSCTMLVYVLNVTKCTKVVSLMDCSSHTDVVVVYGMDV